MKKLLILLLISCNSHITLAKSLENITDPLNSDWLIRADDLIIQIPDYSGTLTTTNITINSTSTQWWAFETDDNAIDNEDDSNSLFTSSCSATWPLTQPYPLHVRTGRFYELNRDLVVSLSANQNASGSGCIGTDNISLILQDAQDPSSPLTVTSSTLSISPADWIQMGVEDVNADGYDDIIILSPNEIIIATVKEITSDTYSFSFYKTALDSSLYPLTEPAFGDLNNDGNIEVIWTASEGILNDASSTDSYPVSIYFATICSGAENGTYCSSNNLTTFDVSLSPQQASPIALENVNISKDISNCDSNGNEYDEMAVPATVVAAGTFVDDDFGDKIIIAAQEATSDSCAFNAYYYTFSEADLTPTQAANITLLDEKDSIRRLFQVTGKLDWNSATEQMILLYEGLKNTTEQQRISILSIVDSQIQNTTTTLTLGNDIIAGKYNVLEGATKGLTLGRFSSIDANALTADSFDQYIALFRDETYEKSITSIFQGHRVLIYSIDNSDYSINKESQYVHKTQDTYIVADLSYRGGSLLRAGDLRGRGYRLGSPTLIETNDSYHTDVVIAAPPMHLAWLNMNDLADSSLIETGTLANFSMCNQSFDSVESGTLREITDDTYCLVNFNFLSGYFSSTYNTTVTDSSQSTIQDQSSYSSGYKVSYDGKISIGAKDISTDSLEISTSLALTYENGFSQQYQVDSSTSFNVNAATENYDVLWFSQRDYNFYYYPVIGQTVCPTDDTCDDDEKQPLVIGLSGPVSNNHISADGGNIEFYQPVHQVGNVFSYAQNCEALESRYNTSLCATSDNETPATLIGTTDDILVSSADITETASWTTASSTSKTSSTSNNFSYETGATFTSSVGDIKATGAEDTLSFDYSNSTALSTAVTNNTTLGEATGVSISKIGVQLEDTLFSYYIKGYIFGTPFPDDTIDTDDTDDTDTSVNSSTGTLRFIYSTSFPDNSEDGIGSFWITGDSPYQKYIDVGLALPSKFSFTSQDPGETPLATQCRIANSFGGGNCATPESSDTTEIWNASSFQMKGFFITQSEELTGPQIGSINAGETAYLHARIYNFSFTDMATYTTENNKNIDSIIVHFYGQPMNSDNTTNGDAFYIGESNVSLLAGLNSDNDNNWDIATTTFTNTEDYEDNELMFFVLTYAVDTDGNLVSEMPYYGLTNIPNDPTTDITSFSDLALIDTTNTNNNTYIDKVDTIYQQNTDGVETDLPAITFSNNIGYYHSLFYIIPETDSTQSTLNSTEGKISIINKQFDFKKTPEMGDRVTLKLTLAAEDNDARGIETTLWDGDPTDSNSKVIEWEYKPIIHGGGTAEVHIPYTLENCGPNTIYAVVQNQDANDSVTESIDYYIDCRETYGGAADKYFLGLLLLAFMNRMLFYNKNRH